MPTDASHRQTVSFLRERFQQVGIRPDTRHGQNFLIDLNLVDLLVRTADVQPTDVILEVGTGTGGLTARLADRAAAVVTVEIDPCLHQLASEELVGLDNVKLLHQDALRNKNNLHPQVLEAVRAELAEDPARRFKLVANLPYNIATPVISNLLSADPVPVSMTVTIQKELADRITARPGTKDYGALSVWVQSLCHAELIRVLPPDVFWPRPKVHSAILHILPSDELRQRIAHLEFFHRFVRNLFLHRRKFLRSGLLSATAKRLSKPDVDQIMQQLSLDATSRAEQLDIGMLLKLCEAVRDKTGPIQG
jgi:16S rRNA (adenine1518-N6/adenine1519-N6)-dimethyltransferase